MKTMTFTKRKNTDKVPRKFKNRLNGDIVYSQNAQTKFIDGVEFLEVFSAPTPHRKNWMKKDNLERIS